MNSKYREVAIKIVKDHLGPKIDIEETFEEMGADSLDLVEMVMALEEHFDIEIADEDAEKLKTVADVCAYLDEVG